MGLSPALIATFPAAPPKIPYVGFSPVRLEVQVPVSLRMTLPRIRSPHYIGSTTMRVPYRVWPSPRDGRFVNILLLGSESERMCPRHPVLNPEILAPAGLCCPSHHRLAISSASLATSHPFPSSAGYRVGLWHSRIILPGHQTFRAFTTGLSGIAAFNFRREPGTCPSQLLPCQHWPSSSSANSWHSNYPATNFPQGFYFDGSSVRSRYGPSVCSPPGLVRPEPMARPPRACTPGLPAAWSPAQRPGITTASHWDLRRRDFHP